MRFGAIEPQTIKQLIALAIFLTFCWMLYQHLKSPFTEMMKEMKSASNEVPKKKKVWNSKSRKYEYK
jgi:hypothetical protein